MTKKRKRSLCSLYHFGFICLWKTFKPFSTSVISMTLKPLKYTEIFLGGKRIRNVFQGNIFFLQILLMNNSECWGVAPHDKLMISQTIWYFMRIIDINTQSWWSAAVFTITSLPFLLHVSSVCWLHYMTLKNVSVKNKCNELNCKKKKTNKKHRRNINERSHLPPSSILLV